MHRPYIMDILKQVHLRLPWWACQRTKGDDVSVVGVNTKSKLLIGYRIEEEKCEDVLHDPEQ
jgi:hypothetical protein